MEHNEEFTLQLVEDGVFCCAKESPCYKIATAYKNRDSISPQLISIKQND